MDALIQAWKMARNLCPTQTVFKHRLIRNSSRSQARLPLVMQMSERIYRVTKNVDVVKALQDLRRTEHLITKSRMAHFIVRSIRVRRTNVLRG